MSENLSYKDVNKLGLRKDLVSEYPWLALIWCLTFKVFIVLGQVNLGIWWFKFSSD